MSKYLSEKQPKAFKAIIGDLREPSKLRDSMKKPSKLIASSKKEIFSLTCFLIGTPVTKNLETLRPRIFDEASLLIAPPLTILSP